MTPIDFDLAIVEMANAAEVIEAIKERIASANQRLDEMDAKKAALVVTSKTRTPNMRPARA